MTLHHGLRAALVGGLLVSLSACGIGSGDSGLFGPRKSGTTADGTLTGKQAGDAQRANIEAASGDTIRLAKDLPSAADQKALAGLFGNSADPNTTVEVNKYIWNAALDVLNFLPIETVDPFTGVIVNGYGHPPGGGRAYRATVLVQDPALDARSLKLALQSRGGGAVSRETLRAVEDAILSRARQLRIRDSKL
ncbi:MAG: DUF3576 domain-containing protein [Paracoccaceae bacterium]|nr:DUF3576 domain-containing protein [Paracoccaceae bacterium]